MKSLFASLLLFLAVIARGQDTNQFHAFASSVDLIEGGRVPIVVVDWGELRLTLRCPIGFASHVDNYMRQIKFDADSGAVAINITVTTNSPEGLPAEDDLKNLAVSRHPGSWVLQARGFPTSYKSGYFVDLAQAPAANISLRTRHAFVATSQGMVEFVFAGNDTDFDKYKVGFMQSLGAFALEPILPKQPPPEASDH